MQNSINALAVIAALLVSSPSAARLTKLTVTGKILTGNDDGTDLINVSNIGGVYVHTYAPGTFFGSAGSLAGKAVKFTILFDPDAIGTPLGVAGVFEDPLGEWPLSLSAKFSVDGVSRDLVKLAPGMSGFAIGAKLTLVDGVVDSLAGDFSSLTISGGNILDFWSSNVSFGGILPASFLTTDASLPGSLPAPGYGYGNGSAAGTGSFAFYDSTCFIDCSAKAATGTFMMTGARFGAVPEPASWAMLLIGFGLVGFARRRRHHAAAVAA